VDRFVHADVERLPARARVVERGQDRRAEIVDVDEVALHRHAVGVLHDRNGARPGVVVGRLAPDEVAPARPADDLLAERQLVAEVVLLHAPRRAQAAAAHVVLDVVPLQHHLFEPLRQPVTKSRLLMSVPPRPASPTLTPTSTPTCLSTAASPSLLHWRPKAPGSSRTADRRSPRSG